MPEEIKYIIQPEKIMDMVIKQEEEEAVGLEIARINIKKMLEELPELYKHEDAKIKIIINGTHGNDVINYAFNAIRQGAGFKLVNAYLKEELEKVDKEIQEIHVMYAKIEEKMKVNMGKC